MKHNKNKQISGEWLVKVRLPKLGKVKARTDIFGFPSKRMAFGFMQDITRGNVGVQYCFNRF
jgi:hypothetical protein